MNIQKFESKFSEYNISAKGQSIFRKLYAIYRESYWTL